MGETIESRPGPRPVEPSGQANGVHPKSELTVENHFHEQAPAYASKADDIIDLILAGTMTIADAITQSEAPVRVIVERMCRTFKLPAEVRKELRQAQITRSMLSVNREEVHSAIKLDQKEESIHQAAGGREMSPEMRELIQKEVSRQKESKEEEKCQTNI